MTARTVRRRGAARDVAVGVAAALVVFAAVPGVLVGLVGAPLPDHWTRAAVVSTHGLFDLLALVAWAAWASCAWSLLCSVVTRVRARDVTAGSRPLDRVAVRIAAAFLVLSSVTGAGAATAGAAAVHRPAHAVGVHARTARRPSPDLPPATAARPGLHVVTADESLWSVAEAHYEDGPAWPALVAANLGARATEHARFLDPASPPVGARLTVPVLDGAAASQVPDAPQLPLPVKGGDGGTLPAPELPELVALGAGSLVAALIARRARRAQRLRAFVRAEGSTTCPPGPRRADLAVTVAPFADVPLADWAEVALRHLRAAVAVAVRGEAPDRLPAVELARVGNDGVELRLASPSPWVLGGWTAPTPRTLLLPATHDLGELRRAASDHGPWCPVLLPVGHDEEGSWLVPVTAGGCVAVVGPCAPDLLRAMRAAATGWSWVEDLVVTDDPDTATAESGASGARRPDGSAEVRVLFLGDPRTLPAPARRSCAVLTGVPLSRADVTILVDGRAATIHPYGVSVRPHLLDASWGPALEELEAETGPHPAPPVRGPETAGAARSPRPLVHRGPVASVRVGTVVPRGGDAVRGSAPRAQRSGALEGTAPGRVEVRLLAPAPSVVGMPETLPTKRARRAVELLAYLALHSPDPVTGDRLRTRVLGSADADAAAKTLFNVAGAARRALGLGEDGDPLLPPATRGGHYSLSPDVTIDVRRMERMLTAGLAHRERAERDALLHEGLALVQGEPLGAVLAGYAWWRAEGHERRVADLVVDAAAALVRSSTQSGRLDVARWALERARLVEPYSEVLARAAMTVAAAAGDARRLHEEWLECCRQIDELDPGATPSEETEHLYGSLRARTAEGTPPRVVAGLGV